MNKHLRRGFRGFAIALAAGSMAGCVVDDYAGPAITLTGGYQGVTLGVTLGGRRPAAGPNPVEEAMALLSIQGLPADAKQPISKPTK